MSEFRVHKVGDSGLGPNSAGVAARVCWIRFVPDVSLENAKKLANESLGKCRYIIVDEAGVQHFSSDKRDEGGVKLLNEPEFYKAGAIVDLA